MSQKLSHTHRRHHWATCSPHDRGVDPAANSQQNQENWGRPRDTRQTFYTSKGQSSISEIMLGMLKPKHQRGGVRIEEICKPEMKAESWNKAFPSSGGVIYGLWKRGPPAYWLFVSPVLAISLGGLTLHGALCPTCLQCSPRVVSSVKMLLVQLWKQPDWQLSHFKGMWKMELIRSLLISLYFTSTFPKWSLLTKGE